ncbi:hypothetical protein CSE16_09220 [Solibacillus sp. R5-41]|uniref:hypothetical protein n=1 Tax=Solibacillus sp. R5-41 TaxID=2048654 RepID=UPI000C125383|nr:hypothetical protein [Solibacillus sp. R5-41]ATP40206.1 hypothetical protein CSE16_09220 [Solibacillus sp. R5-41]
MIEYVCKAFGIQPGSFKYFRQGERLLIKVTSITGEDYYIKGEQTERSYTEACCQFAQKLLENGILVTKYLKSDEKMFTIVYNPYLITMEKAIIGEELTKVNDGIIEILGRFLARQHQFSLSICSPFQQETSWSMFGGNATELLGDYDENERSFWAFRDAFYAHPKFYLIEELYMKHRNQLNSVWSNLPQSAVQGDCCYYNFIKTQEGLTLLDFNLAGNEVLLNECIAVGVYHSWHVAYDGSLTPEERFALYMKAYTHIRPLTELEKNNFSRLKSIIRAFRYDRIEAGIACKKETFVDETYSILNEGNLQMS